MTRRFREALPEDLPLLLDLERAAFDRPWPAGAFEQELELPQAEVVLAFEGPDERAAAGYVDLWVVQDEIQILNVAVHPDRRRGGLGRALLAEAERRGRDRGGERVFLEVRVTNAPALALYRGAGYVQAGVRKRYYSDTGEDAVVMMKELGAAPG